jgi:hypothetical protein
LFSGRARVSQAGLRFLPLSSVEAAMTNVALD